MSNAFVDLLGSLSPRPMRYEMGAALFRMGDPIHLVHFVHGGTVHLLRHTSAGAALILQRASAGSILAEASLLADAYHCDAEAVTAVEVLAVPRRALRDRLGANAEFAMAWIGHLGREVQQARLHAEIMAMKTVASRLDAWLAWRGALPPKGDWKSVAAEIGVSPEALYREIAQRKHRNAAPRPADRGSLQKATDVID